MKEHILPAIRLTIVCILFFCGIYTLFIMGIAQAAPAKGNGQTVIVNGKVVGYKLIGQKFTDDKYFWAALLLWIIMLQVLAEAIKVQPTPII